MIVGLGNPGPRYATTRHNIGFAVVDQLAGSAGADWVAEAATRSQWSMVEWAGVVAALVKPQTYMNSSGLTVAALLEKWPVETQDILVLLDDFLLQSGRLRFRRKGSDGGHNGLASVIEELGTRDIPRLRLGIGQPGPDEEIIDYVLSPFASAEDLAELTDKGCAAVDMYMQEGIEPAMNHFNGL
ncbi:MAG: aminoacyl-tRNA hydrolase [Candidatus Latescibacteria bacterium]|nr:aminoacyl-tRNA hydrolase [Candidatus Latescibacterota bacterium]